MGDTSPFRYAERRPLASLLPWVRNHWSLSVHEGAPEVHYVPPDGSTALVLNVANRLPPTLHLSGPWLEPLAVPVKPGDTYVGIRLQPGALRPLLGLPPEALRNRVIPAATLLGPLADRITAALLEEASVDGANPIDPLLTDLASRATPPDAMVAEVVARLIASGGDTPIADLASEAGVSARTLHRRFLAATGIAPKQFARIRRLLEAGWTLATTRRTWGQVAHTAGYADQPHLHRDVAGLTGLTPGQWGERIRSTDHDDVIP